MIFFRKMKLLFAMLWLWEMFSLSNQFVLKTTKETQIYSVNSTTEAEPKPLPPPSTPRPPPPPPSKRHPKPPQPQPQPTYLPQPLHSPQPAPPTLTKSQTQPPQPTQPQSQPDILNSSITPIVDARMNDICSSFNQDVKKNHLITELGAKCNCHQFPSLCNMLTNGANFSSVCNHLRSRQAISVSVVETLSTFDCNCTEFKNTCSLFQSRNSATVSLRLSSILAIVVSLLSWLYQL